MRAYGWTPTGDIIDTEADHLSDMADQVIAGVPIKRIAAELDDAGVETVSGKRWSPLTIRRALTSSRIVGDKDGVPAILNRARYNKVVKILTDPERAKFAPKGTTSWLSGMVRCSRCGQIMYPQVDDFKCSARGSEQAGCGAMSIRRLLVESDTEARIVARLSDGKWRRALAKELGKADPDELEQTIEDAESRIEKIAEVFGRGESNPDAFEKGVAAAQEQITGALATLDRASALRDLPEPVVEDVIAWWEGLPMDERKRVAAILLDHIDVYPKADRDRLRYRWQ